MSCLNCGATNLPGALTCARCSAYLPRPTTGPAETLLATHPPAARSSSAMPGRAELRGSDRRVVTILFADLSGFTKLAERTDLEQVTVEEEEE